MGKLLYGILRNVLAVCTVLHKKIFELTDQKFKKMYRK